MSDIDDLIKRLDRLDCDCNDDFICPKCSAAQALREQQAEIERLKARYAKCIEDMDEWDSYYATP